MSDTALVQQKLGLAQTDVWSQSLEAALASYQSGHGIVPTGNPDPFTLAAMGIYDPLAGAPSSFKQSLATGKPAGHYGRDVVTTLNQIPRWGYVTLGVGFAGLAFLSWWTRGRGS